MEAERAAQREADRLADEAFTKEFLAAAMEVFRLLDTDESMSLDHDEFVGGVGKSGRLGDCSTMSRSTG